MNILTFKRLLYNNREELINDLKLDESVSCMTCIVHSSETRDGCYGYCNGMCTCDHKLCENCDMECHKKCSCNCDHNNCEENCEGMCHEKCNYIDRPTDIVETILNYAFCNNGLNIFIKYNTIFNSNDIYINRPYNYLLEKCLCGNFGDCNFGKNAKLLQKERFDNLIKCKEIDYNHIYYFGNILCATDNTYFLDKLIECGSDVNLIFDKDQTVVSSLLYNIIGCEPTCNQSKIKKLEYLLNKGADLNLGNIRTISGIQYEDRPKRINFVRYLIDKGLNIENRIIFKNKMLYDTRLGKLIIKIKNMKL